MKVDTKTLSAFKNEAAGSPFLIRKNKEVPLATDASNGRRSGRSVRFETTIIHTPVFSSSRNAEKRALLTEQGVDDLQGMLSALSITASPSRTTSPPSKTSPNKQEEKNDDESCGRFQCTTYSKKAGGDVNVKRSSRLNKNND
jgi:hypothetical protein